MAVGTSCELGVIESNLEDAVQRLTDLAIAESEWVVKRMHEGRNFQKQVLENEQNSQINFLRIPVAKNNFDFNVKSSQSLIDTLKKEKDQLMQELKTQPDLDMSDFDLILKDYRRLILDREVLIQAEINQRKKECREELNKQALDRYIKNMVKIDELNQTLKRAELIEIDSSSSDEPIIEHTISGVKSIRYRKPIDVRNKKIRQLKREIRDVKAKLVKIRDENDQLDKRMIEYSMLIDKFCRNYPDLV